MKNFLISILALIQLLLMPTATWPADVKISELPAVTTLAGSDVVPAVASNVTSKITVTNLKTIFQPSLSLLKGTYTDGYFCTYASSGTLLNCNTDPSSFGGNVAADAIWDAAGDLIYGTGANTASRLAHPGATNYIFSTTGGSSLGWTTTPTFATLALTGANSLALGTSGSALGRQVFYNVTSGSLTVEPVAGALGAATLVLGKTFTDNKWCSYSASTGFTCNENSPAGGGTVTGVGDCASAACLDGTSDGGTYVKFYDTEGATTLQGGNIAGNITLTLPTTTGTLALDTIKPSDLTITSQAAGDVLYFNGTNWVRLAKDVGKWLQSGASAVVWATPAGSGDFLADGTVPMTGAIVPNAANTLAVGSATAEFSDLYLGDGAIIYGQNDQSATLTSSASLWTANNFASTNYVAIGADPADAGSIRLPNAGYIYSEASPAGTDVSIIGVTSAELIQIGASGSSGVTITPNTTITGTTKTTGALSPNSAGGTTVGTAALPYSSAYIGGSATNNIRLTGTSASAVIATLPGQTGTIALGPVSTTAGQVFQATATSGLGAYSTPTYPVASGTNRTILVSNGTNNVYSTETWAVPSTSGNVLVSDGTNWTSAANPSIAKSVITAEGDVVVGSGSAAATVINKGAANSVFGTNASSTLGFYAQASLGDGGNQFFSETASKGFLKILLSGSTNNKTMTIASSQTDDRTLTLPDATGTLALTTLIPASITNSASPTIDAAGKIAIDTTSDQLKYYGTAAEVVPSLQFQSFVIPAPADTDDINLMKAPYGMTITGISCIVQGTTSATGQLQECDSAGANCADLDGDIACDADGAADDGTLTDSAIASGGWLRWKTTSVSGTPTFLTVTFKYKVVGD